MGFLCKMQKISKKAGLLSKFVHFVMIPDGFLKSWSNLFKKTAFFETFLKIVALGINLKSISFKTWGTSSPPTFSYCTPHSFLAGPLSTKIDHRLSAYLAGVINDPWQASHPKAEQIGLDEMLVMRGSTYLILSRSKKKKILVEFASVTNLYVFLIFCMFHLTV